MYRCASCGGIHVYELELRTDYNNFRSIEPLNNDVEDMPELTNDDIAYYLDMNYCYDCESIVNVEYVDDDTESKQ